MFHGKAGCLPIPELHNVTLHYFTLRGRAEAIRLIMEDTGIAYEQNLFTGATWPDSKKAGIESGIFPFGQGSYKIQHVAVLLLFFFFWGGGFPF